MTPWAGTWIELELEPHGRDVVCRWRLDGAATWRTFSIAGDARQTPLDLISAVLTLVALELQAAAA